MKKIENTIGEKEGNKKNKKTNPALVFVGAIFIMIILLLFVVIISTQTNNNKNGEGNDANPESEENIEFAAYFDGCDLLDSKCLDTNCGQYFLCNDQKYKICEVYDCDAEFGIGTKNENGEINIERKAKDNRDKIIEIKSRCGGSLEIIESNYADGKLEAKVKVTTVGDCEISGFLMSCKNSETDEVSSFKPAKFLSLDNNFYAVSVSDCVEISEVIAIGENGISIK